MDNYGQHSMNSVTSGMNHMTVNGTSTSLQSVYYPTINNTVNDDFLPSEFVKGHIPSVSSPTMSRNNIVDTSSALNIVPSIPQPQPSYDSEVLNHLRNGMTRVMATLERLEQRMNRVEQVTNQVLKNQQESFQVPFMSQKEIDNARSLAEQLEQDTSVAKQLQAAYNKEIEIRKHSAPAVVLAECPVCGVRVNQMELEHHVEQCLDEFSSDPKKQVEVKETKQKMETGFFGKFFNKTKTETTTSTKVISSRSNSNASFPEEGNPQNYPSYGYPFMNPQQMNAMQMQQMQSMNGMPMMMPMYMYPGYPGMPPTSE